jgi:hypothetical protein
LEMESQIVTERTRIFELEVEVERLNSKLEHCQEVISAYVILIFEYRQLIIELEAKLKEEDKINQLRKSLEKIIVV